MEIKNSTRGVVLATDGRIARTFWQRLQGLLGKAFFPEGEALVFYHCGSIHTFFMKFPIDVIFVDKSLKIIHLYHDFPSGRISKFLFGVFAVIELPRGVLSKTNTHPGDILSF